jgi:hypothetical protein
LCRHGQKEKTNENEEEGKEIGKKITRGGAFGRGEKKRSRDKGDATEKKRETGAEGERDRKRQKR